MIAVADAGKVSAGTNTFEHCFKFIAASETSSATVPDDDKHPPGNE